MPVPFKPTRRYPLPPNPEIVDRDGRPHVRVTSGGKAAFYKLTKDGTGYLKPAKKWYAEIKGSDGVTRRVPLSANKDAARMLLAERLLRVERERAGLVDRSATHRTRPLTGHLDDWLAVLAARGRAADYIALKKARVVAILAGCGFRLPADLSAEKLELFLEALRAGPKRLSVQTTNDYLQAVVQFVRWMQENDRIAKNPFTRMKKGNAERDRRHVRRVLDVAELSALVAATRTSGVIRRRLSGEARAALYEVAAYTGYRAIELAALTPADFRLDAAPPTVDLSGEFTKNGKDASQPIPVALAAGLRGFLDASPTDGPVWPGTWPDRAAEVIRADAAAARLVLDVDTKDGPQVLDFHSLRGTYATLLDGLDISLKARQELMRHSDPRLTLNRYTRVRLHDLGAAVDRLPKLGPPIPGRESAMARATGTDGGCSADAVAGGSGREQSGVGGEICTATGSGALVEPGKSKPLAEQGFEDNRERLGTIGSGEGGIRTRGGVLPPRRFSKAVLSTTQPPLRVVQFVAVTSFESLRIDRTSGPIPRV